MPARRAVLMVATLLLAAGAVGCASAQRPSGTTAAPTASPPAANSTDPDPGPLPAPEALTDVMYRVADPAVPGADKLGLIAAATPPEAATLDGFAAALRDGGFAPVTFTAADIGWTGQPSTVRATITVSTTNPADPPDFTFPMEFRSTPGGWQLTRETAEMLFSIDR